jgi:phosphopentomutase
MQDYKRFIIIVLDSVGIGELPDANLFNDQGSNTLGHIAEKAKSFQIPNLVNLGLGNIDPTNKIPKVSNALAVYGKMAEMSLGKDTTTGHWEIAGIVLKQAFPTFMDGFPKAFIEAFEQQIGIKTIGNYAASGTEIINELGDEHVKTQKPIVYTSADSVFQIAMHEDIYPIQKQYEICTIAREMLTGELAVGRVIARPFLGSNGNYTRTKNRKDFSLEPSYSLLDSVQDHGLSVLGIGKISDIFAGKGINQSIKTANNEEGIKATIEAIKNDKSASVIFTNLVDFDMHYGHRRDIDGYAKCLEEFDLHIPNLIKNLRSNDVLIITADHGNDPSFKGNDHTREFIPVLVVGEKIKKNIQITQGKSFANIAATVAEGLGINFDTIGESFYKEVVLT